MCARKVKAKIDKISNDIFFRLNANFKHLNVLNELELNEIKINKMHKKKLIFNSINKKCS